eukprot:ANDGO_03266.mRNA.1 hypothetical protein
MASDRASCELNSGSHEFPVQTNTSDNNDINNDGDIDHDRDVSFTQSRAEHADAAAVNADSTQIKIATPGLKLRLRDMPFISTVPLKLFKLPLVAIISGLVSFFFSLLLFYLFGDMPHGALAYLSETGAIHPGTSVFRLGLCFVSGTCVLLSYVLFTYYRALLRSINSSQFGVYVDASFVCGLLAALGIVLLGIISLNDDPFIHGMFAATFFVFMFFQCFFLHVTYMHVVRKTYLSGDSSHRQFPKDIAFWIIYRRIAITCTLLSILAYVIIFPGIRTLIVRCSGRSNCGGWWSANVACQYLSVVSLMMFVVAYVPILRTMKLTLSFVAPVPCAVDVPASIRAEEVVLDRADDQVVATFPDAGALKTESKTENKSNADSQ